MKRDRLRFAIFVPNIADVQIHAAVDCAHLHLVGFPQGFFKNINLCTCMTIWLSLRSSSSSKFATPAATGVGVIDETLHFSEES
jgi:hypothetical protein